MLGERVTTEISKEEKTEVALQLACAALYYLLKTHDLEKMPEFICSGRGDF